jgi:nicotinate-nucleotide adenylyltransferase
MNVQSPTARLGILGGTFDPVHNGHVDVAIAARRTLGLDRVVLLPSRIPPHRTAQPAASPFHRFAMTALAVNGMDGLEASDLELAAPGTSYTSATLERLHGLGLHATQIFFITGADAFAEIATWHRYPEVLEMAHFVVVSRPGHEASALPALLPSLAPRMRLEAVEGGCPERGKKVEGQAEGPAVFLIDWKTPGVSSTEIRRRIRGGEGIGGLVPALVERHITRHRLYLEDSAPQGVGAAADHLHGKD